MRFAWFIILIVSLLLPLVLRGEIPGEVVHDASDDRYEVSLEDNLATPEVPAKRRESVREYMHSQAKKLAAKKLTVERLRRGEVFAVVIPAHELFLPNDTLLRTDSSVNKLSHLAPFFKNEGEYKVIVVVHSDDTGTEPYRYALTEKRVMSLYDWFDGHFPHTENLFGYGVGSDMPLKPNTTAAGRRANRRVEVYVVPDEGVLNNIK